MIWDSGAHGPGSQLGLIVSTETDYSGSCRVSCSWFCISLSSRLPKARYSLYLWARRYKILEGDSEICSIWCLLIQKVCNIDCSPYTYTFWLVNLPSVCGAWLSGCVALLCAIAVCSLCSIGVDKLNVLVSELSFFFFFFKFQLKQCLLKPSSLQ